MTNRDSIFQTSARLLFPPVLVFSSSHVINANSQPGEGFSSGILLALSIVLLYVGLGVRAVDQGMPRLATFGLTAGFVIIVSVALFTVLIGESFLTVHTARFDLLGSELELSTSLLFELGILLVLSGGTLGLFRSVGLEEEEQP